MLQYGQGGTYAAIVRQDCARLDVKTNLLTLEILFYLDKVQYFGTWYLLHASSPQRPLTSSRAEMHFCENSLS